MNSIILERPDRRLSVKTIPVIPSPDKEADGNIPSFIRLPAERERCPWTGLSRGTMNMLVLGEKPAVRSVVLRQPGSKRGVRLIHLASLLAYLHREMAAQLEETQQEGVTA